MELTVLRMLVIIAKDPLLDVYRCHGYAYVKTVDVKKRKTKVYLAR